MNVFTNLAIFIFCSSLTCAIRNKLIPGHWPRCKNEFLFLQPDELYADVDQQTQVFYWGKDQSFFGEPESVVARFQNKEGAYCDFTQKIIDFKSRKPNAGLIKHRIPHSLGSSVTMTITLKDNQGDIIAHKKENVHVRNHLPSLIMSQLSKPQYRPGETIKLRLVRLKTNKVLDVNRYVAMNCKQLKPLNKIENPDLYVKIFNPSKILRYQNLQLGKLEASFIEFQLSEDAKQGDWKILYGEIGSSETTLTVPVKQYVLPRFATSINLKQLPAFKKTVDDHRMENVFEVETCGKYSNDRRPLRAQLIGVLCNCGSNLIGQKPSKGCDHPQVPLRPALREHCININTTIVNQCVSIKKNLSDWRNSNGHLNGLLSLSLTMREIGTNYLLDLKEKYWPSRGSNMVIKSISTTNIHFPFWLKVAKPNDDRIYKISLEDKTGKKDTISYQIKRDEEEFMFPPSDAETLLTIKRENDDKTFEIIEKKHLFTISREKLQVWPENILYYKQDTCPKNISVRLLMAKNLNSNIIYFQSQNLLSNIYQEFSIDNNTCISRSDAYGHYICDSNGKMKCFQGWSGSNCMYQDCKVNCGEDKITFDLLKLEINLEKLNAPELRGMFYYIDGRQRLATTPLWIKGLYGCTSKLNRLESSSKYIKNNGFYFEPNIVKPGENLSLNVQFPSKSITENDFCHITAFDANLKNLEKNQRSQSAMQKYMVIYQKAFSMNNNEQKSLTNHDPVKFSSMIKRGECPTYFERRRLNMALPFEMSAAPPSKDSVNIRFKSDTPITIRDFFPESWIFKSKEINVLNPKLGISGLDMNLTAPDAITKWKAAAFCTTVDQGLFIPNKFAELTVNKPFNVEINLPKKAVRGEILHLNIGVFFNEKTLNEINNLVKLKAVIDGNRDWELLSDKSIEFCTGPQNEERIQEFVLKPIKFGKLKFTVAAEAEIDSSKCGKSIQQLNKSPQLLTDGVQREIRVVFEGEPNELTVSSIMCLNDVTSLKSNNGLNSSSKQVVPDSLRLYSGVTGDILSLPAANLDKLVKVPTGCGEQNMIKVAPSVFVLQYLSRKNDNYETKTTVTELALRKKARGFIKKGFERQLRYIHNDGSFSAFGKSDEHGSTWLTAFVLRTFAEAYGFVKDTDILKIFEDGVNFLQKMVNSKQCFIEKGNVIHKKMQGSISSKNSKLQNDLALSTYVLTSLVKIQGSNVFADQKLEKYLITLIEDTEKCIAQNYMAKLFDGVELNIDTLSYVQLVYSISLLPNEVGPLKQHFTVLKDRLISLMNSENGLSFWADDGNSKEENIQCSAYGFLVLRPYLSIDEQVPHIKWLVQQQSSTGGYYSTQDTVLALEALSWFILPEINNNVSVISDFEGESNAFEINTTNLQVYQQKLLKGNFSYNRNSTDVTWKVKPITNFGCIQVISTLFYNLKKTKYRYESRNIPFSLEVNLTKDYKHFCNKVQLHFCLKPSSNKLQSTGMLLVKVENPTGYSVDMESVEKLAKPHPSGPKRVDVKDDDEENSVSLYFDAFSGNNAYEERCAKLTLVKDLRVDDLQPGSIIAMDYYDTEKTLKQDIDFTCV